MKKELDLRKCKPLIEKTVSELNQIDGNWTWRVSYVGQSEIHLEWKYLKYHGDAYPYFTIKWMWEMKIFAVYDGEGNSITDRLRVVDDLRLVMISILLYIEEEY